MISIISPAKRLDFSQNIVIDEKTIPERLDQSAVLIKKLRSLSKKKIATLMSLSDDLAQLNYNRYQDWEPEFGEEDSRQCLLAFKGEVYLGIEAEGFTSEDFAYSQEHLRILSGLHGLLRPLDLIHPYRLEMGSALKVGRKKNLYEFWGDALTEEINQLLESHSEKVLVNLASNEYFKAVNTNKLDAEVVQCEFKEARNGGYKMIGTYAKRARGLMVRYMVTNRIDATEGLKGFDLDNYAFNEELSSEKSFVFTR